ncbi:ORF1118 [White spot syndrome virus]|uniref:ORF1118 n=1 Tax=White spot syndrome virus TaxID=342409 RepID=A0A2D3I6W6_9VIRU|nr:ORF1118 [White spot syndrome virus]
MYFPLMSFMASIFLIITCIKSWIAAASVSVEEEVEVVEPSSAAAAALSSAVSSLDEQDLILLNV